MEDDVLARFCRVVLDCPQTPDLINRVADDVGYVRICRHLCANPEDAGFTAFCEKNQFNARRIRMRLHPVAQALRIDGAAAAEPLDYYALLGVAVGSDAQTIKRAFRQKAHLVHPDKQPGDDGQSFLLLQTAYVHLNNLELRARYDQQRSMLNWIETQPGPRNRRPLWGLRRSTWLIGMLAVALVAAAYGIDLYFQESSLFKEGKSLQGSSFIDIKDAEQGDASPPRKLGDTAATDGATGEEQLEDRLKSFLDEFCAAYAGENLEKFSALFLPDATEQGKPFASVLPGYGRFFDEVVQLDYRIHLVSFRRAERCIALEGEFALSCTMSDGRKEISSGPIRMELLETVTRLWIRKLEYGSI